MSNTQLFAEWLNKINAYAKSKDPNCRVMIWDDMVSPFHNGGTKDYQLKYGGPPGMMAEVIEQNMIDNNVIMNIWWYRNSSLNRMIAATQFFSKRGYNFLGAPWYDLENIQSWSELLLNRPGSLGGF